jgi:hypothetical protein
MDTSARSPHPPVKIGDRFGSKTVIGFAPRPPGSPKRVTYRCDCGYVSTVREYGLRAHPTPSCRSCGNGQRKHGGKQRSGATSEYRSWRAMVQRTNDPNARSYADYGGRGITVCDEWRDFRNFLRDMGPKPTPAHTLERKDSTLGYYAANCRWATKAEQNRNTRTSRFLELDGRRQTLAEWAREIGINAHSLAERIDKGGWSIKRALTTPKIPTGEHRKGKRIGEHG